MAGRTKTREPTWEAATVPATPEDEPLPASVGRFRIDARLGSGGFADVYRAHDPVLDRAVALKVLRTRRSHDEEQRRRRVLREARAAAALTHPNTVTIFEVGEADGEIFLAMELLDGSPLRERMDDDVPLEQKLRWLLGAARALAAAHDRGLVHRDVKPENMFVCAEGTLKLLDFGIAKREELDVVADADPAEAPSSLRTTEGRRIGTPRYMAPEQRTGDPTDARTDEYAWGLVAFELLTGYHAVAGVSTMTVPGAASPEEDPIVSSASRLARLREVVPELPDAVAGAIARALEPDASKRYASMAPIVEVLEAALATPAPATTPRSVTPSPSRGWLAVPLAAALLAGAFAITPRPRPAAVAPAPPPPAAPPACVVDRLRTYALDVLDSGTMLPDGRMMRRRTVLGRNDRSSVYEIEGAKGLEPITAPLLDQYEQPRIVGAKRRGKPAVVFLDTMSFRTGIWEVGVHFPEGRPWGRPFAMAAATTYRGDPVTLVTALDNQGWIGLEVAGDDSAITWGKVGPRMVGSPAVASDDTRIAIAFLHSPTSIRFGFVDARAQPVGDLFELPTEGPSPVAIAFAGRDAIVYWFTVQGTSYHLTSAALRPGAKDFAAKNVGEEPVSVTPPATTRLSDGSFAIAWVGAEMGEQILRVARVGDGGALLDAVDVARGEIDGIQILETPDGLGVTWIDPRAHQLHGARVGCL